MVDFTFRRSIFRIREMSFAKYDEIGREKCDVVCLHSSDQDLSRAPSNAYTKLQYTLVNCLQASDDDLWGKVTKTCRYEIRRAEKEGVIINVYQDKHECIANGVISEFQKVYNEMFKIKNLKYCFNKSLVLAGMEAKQIVITRGSLPQDSSCVVYHAYLADGNSAELMYSVSSLWEDNDKEKTNAIGRINKNLHWKDMLWFKEHGYSRYEWGGISNPHEPAGRDRFKAEFGGEVTCYANYHIPFSLLGRIYVELVKRRRR